MYGAVAAGQTVVCEAGHLKISSLEHDNRAWQQVEINAHGEQVVEPAERANIIQLVLGQVDVAQMKEAAQQVDVGQTAAVVHNTEQQLSYCRDGRAMLHKSNIRFRLGGASLARTRSR